MLFCPTGEITLPTPQTNDDLKKDLKLRIESGQYTVGEIIVPKKYEKLVVDKEGNVKMEEFVVEGRKRPLEEIRKKTLVKHKQFIRQYGDEHYDEMTRLDVSNRLDNLGELDDGEGLMAMREKLKKLERQRHLLVWHDHSTVANHGHIVFMVSSIYDPAFFLTPEEYQQKTGELVDIQIEVEKPDIYIVGRCASSDVEQLAYIETRCDCLNQLTDQIEVSPGIPVSDVMRFFKGDGRAVAFETGQQKGGNFCSVCGMHAVMGDDLSHVFRWKHRSLQDKQKVILAGPIGRGNSLLGKPKPLKALKKGELLEELGERGLLKEVKSDKKVDLDSELMSQLRGVQRVPALLYSSPATPLEDVGLASYEALPCEPMHDLSNHISNLLEELPKHLTGEQKRKFEETWELTLAGNETKRTSDYRSAIILFSRRMRGFLPETLQTLLDTLVEMEEVLCSKDYKRCPRMILRYHNVSFLHFAICHLEFGSTPSAQSARKLYGKYLHNLVSHEPIQRRLISGQSSNAENEERIFNAIEGNTNSTSSYKPGHVIANVFLRLQVEEEFSTFQHAQTAQQKQQSGITNLAATLPKFGNTKIPTWILYEAKYSKWWQAHLERISDFLLPGKGIWWNYDELRGEVEFFDSDAEHDTHSEGPILHHFRSSDFKKEEEYLSQCWEECMQQKVEVPAQMARSHKSRPTIWKRALMVTSSSLKIERKVSQAITRKYLTKIKTQ